MRNKIVSIIFSLILFSSCVHKAPPDTAELQKKLDNCRSENAALTQAIEDQIRSVEELQTEIDDLQRRCR